MHKITNTRARVILNALNRDVYYTSEINMNDILYIIRNIDGLCFAPKFKINRSDIKYTHRK